jgi:hypothetical protein
MQFRTNEYLARAVGYTFAETGRAGTDCYLSVSRYRDEITVNAAHKEGSSTVFLRPDDALALADALQRAAVAKLEQSATA